MDRPNAVALGTAGLLIAVTLVSAPFIGSPVTPDAGSEFAPSSGRIDATVVSTPNSITIDQARFGAHVAHLRAPPVYLDVAEVSGQPTVSYKLRFEKQGYATATVSFPNESVSGRYALEFNEQTIDPDRFERDEYNVTLRVVARDGTGERVLANRTVTAEVVT
jgi:hypothetical protein